MDQERRRPVVTALIGLAGSADYRDRTDAGSALASFADVDEARATLLSLVLDAGDTWVSRVTAEALLRRQDPVGLAIVADALAAADFQHQTHIHDAVCAVFGIYASHRDKAIEICDGLTGDAGVNTRPGAAVLRDMLARIRPVLFPQERA